MAGITARLSGEVKCSAFSTAFKQLVRDVGGELGIPFDVTIPAAKVGELTVRGSNTAGTLTMAASHGIATADTFDLYWINTDGSVGRRYDVVAGTVATNSVPISGGSGDNLPPLNTAVTTQEATPRDLVVVGDDAVCILADADGASATVRVRYDDGGATLKLAIELDTARDSYVWDENSGLTNPLASVTTQDVMLSHGDSTKEVRIRGIVIYG